MTQDELKSSLKAIADKQWATNQQAILLSAVGLELAKDYRTLLDGKSLKVFIKETGEDNGYRLVEHPTQAAKVALAPLDAKFEFVATAAEELPKKSVAFRHRENRALALLEILATLPEEDIAQISIPVSVFVKLHK
ncbi:MAG: hypothetical protein ACYCQH_09285 [Acidithiobacillus ferrooxidans]|jgi:hypothetical protein|uniref:Uncharacterized protein n=1 Tax=mine drainage metagenome TaxID=410659 RepID=E6Q9U3_9ZZZZ|nr:hypothetical protein [Acidithiobacillus sp.]